MNKRLYAIRDNLAEAFVGGVHVFPHDGPAVRFFSDIAADPNTSLAKHLTDHEMFYLGTINEVTGVIEPCGPKPVSIMTGVAWRAAQLTADAAERKLEASR